MQEKDDFDIEQPDISTPPEFRSKQDVENGAHAGGVSQHTTQDEPAETWSHPRRNIYKLSATFWGFIVMGLNDATYGAIIPYLQDYYHLQYSLVSLVFLSPFIGYNFAALLNNQIHVHFGQRGVALLAASCHLLAFTINCLHPPYALLVISFTLAGFGNGLEDAGWNAWIGALPKANEILGFLHASYGLGAVMTPLIATAMITKAGLPWYSWYYCMIGVAAVELVVGVHAFWYETGTKFREIQARTMEAGEEGRSKLKDAILNMPAAKVSWLCGLFSLVEVGVEVAVGGWIVDFMLDVRHADEFASGMSETGYWLGMTVGRLVLGFVTPKLGEKRAILIYLPITMGLELLFWLIPQFYVSVIMVALQGFFLGPMFPTAIVACTALLPRHLHVPAVGFVAAFGGGGGALFPYAIGAIAQAKGVQVLQPFILALLAVSWILWVSLPRWRR